MSTKTGTYGENYPTERHQRTTRDEEKGERKEGESERCPVACTIDRFTPPQPRPSPSSPTVPEIELGGTGTSRLTGPQVQWTVDGHECREDVTEGSIFTVVLDGVEMTLTYY